MKGCKNLWKFIRVWVATQILKWSRIQHFGTVACLVMFAKKSQILMYIMFKKTLTYPWNISSFHLLFTPKMRIKFLHSKLLVCHIWGILQGEKSLIEVILTGHFCSKFQQTLHDLALYTWQVHTVSDPSLQPLNRGRFVQFCEARVLPFVTTMPQPASWESKGAHTHTHQMPCPQGIRPY